MFSHQEVVLAHTEATPTASGYFLLSFSFYWFVTGPDLKLQQSGTELLQATELQGDLLQDLLQLQLAISRSKGRLLNFQRVHLLCLHLQQSRD